MAEFCLIKHRENYIEDVSEISTWFWESIAWLAVRIPVGNASTPKHAPSIKCIETNIKQIKSKETTTTTTIGWSSMEQEIFFLLSKSWVLPPLINDSPSIMRHHNFVPTASWNTAHYNRDGATVTMKPSHVLGFCLFHSTHEISRLGSLVFLTVRCLRTSKEGSCSPSSWYLKSAK